MKKIKLFFQFCTFMFAVSIATWIVSCNEKDDSENADPVLSVKPSVTDIILSQDGATLSEEGKELIQPIRVVTNQPTWDVTCNQTWVKIHKSGNRFYLSAEPSGVTAPAKATLTVIAGSAVPATISVTQTALIPISGITVAPTSLDIKMATSSSLTTSLLPENSNEKEDNTLIWQTSDPNVATVTDGMVSAISNGTAVITVMLERNPSVKTEIPVAVYREEQTNVVYNKPVTHSDFFDVFEGQYAVDGDKTNTSSRWVTDDSNSEHWIAIDLQGFFTINAFQIWRQSITPQDMRRFELQVWMNDGWETVVLEDNCPSDVYPVFYKAFESVTTDKVRWYFPPYIDNRVRMFEIEVYNTVKIY